MRHMVLAINRAILIAERVGNFQQKERGAEGEKKNRKEEEGSFFWVLGYEEKRESKRVRFGRGKGPCEVFLSHFFFLFRSRGTEQKR